MVQTIMVWTPHLAKLLQLSNSPHVLSFWNLGIVISCNVSDSVPFGKFGRWKSLLRHNVSNVSSSSKPYSNFLIFRPPEKTPFSGTAIFVLKSRTARTKTKRSKGLA